MEILEFLVPAMAVVLIIAGASCFVAAVFLFPKVWDIDKRVVDQGLRFYTIDARIDRVLSRVENLELGSKKKKPAARKESDGPLGTALSSETSLRSVVKKAAAKKK